MTKAHPYLILAILTVIFAGASTLYLAHIARESSGPAATEFPSLSGTMSGEYGTLAVNMIDHGIFSRSTTTPLAPDAWRTPGYPAFIAPFYALFGNFYPALIAQIVILFFTAALLYSMASRLMDSRLAFALSVLYLVLPDTLLSVSSLLTETLFTFLFMLAIYLCFFSQWPNLYLRWVYAGVLLGLATYVRPASLYIVPFFMFGYLVFYIGWRQVTRMHILASILLAVGFAATLMPWFYRNEAVFGHFSFASTGAFVLFRQNATQFYETYHDIPNLEARYTLMERAGLPPGPVPQDFAHADALQKVAVEVIAEHPIRYALFHLSAFIPFFTSSGAHNYAFFAQTLDPTFNPAPQPSLIQALHPFSPSELMTVIKNHGPTLIENTFWAVMTILSLLGLKRSSDRRMSWMFFTLILYFALVTGPIAQARYRMPVDALLLLIAFSAAASWGQWRTRQLPSN